tara:strand:+ start:318 stop:476 length:159 start_codon:yes stop_codon:yes gene_type:complete
MKGAIKISRHKLYQSAGLVDDILISGSIESSSTSELLKNEFENVTVLSLATL